MTPETWKRVKAIAIEAWEQPAAERIGYVTSACADDENLKREVLSLVASMADAEDRFEVPPLLREDGISGLRLIGQRVGAYDILSRIGTGGMGEVYKARDTRLGRVVAIKVLPRSASTDPMSRERMAREARAIAALNHPHICTIHDIGTHDGVDFLVMEFVDGETLSTRLSRGNLTVHEAVRYASQLASALGNAHQAGIVHRDVKPANVILHEDRADGGKRQAKLLDFGVAKDHTIERSGIVPGLPAPAVDLTTSGLVVGTAPYMAPEQIERNATDERTDIFALGAVLFEMLTGRKAFEGADRSVVLDAVVTRDVPHPSALRPGVPAVLDRIVAKCLEKNPSNRYQSMEALLRDLGAVQRRLHSSYGPRTVTAVTAVLMLTTAVTWTVWSRRAPLAAPEPAIERLPASVGVIGGAALSPDGSSVVFSWSGDGFESPELALLPLGSTTKKRLTTNRGVEELPAWSPDGKEIAFVRCDSASCGIFALRIEDGRERKIRDLRSDRYFGLAWSPDGRSLVYGERPSTSEPYALFELSLDNSSIRRLTAPPGIGDMRVAFSPDGRTLGIIRVSDKSIGVHLLTLATGVERTLLEGQQEWFGGITWSPDARHLILSANQQGVRRLWKLPVAGGALEQLVIAGEDAYYPAVSAQSKRLIFVRSFRDWDFSRMTLSRGKLEDAPSTFPSSPRLDLDPAFSPDGRTLAFVSERSGTREVWISNADGSNASQLTSFRGAGAGRPSWSPDGRHLAFQSLGINVMPVDGRALRKLAGDGELPTWSADGKWIYFIRSRGKFMPWKVPSAGGTPVQVLDSEVFSVREAPRGRDLYFVRTDGIWRLSLADGQQTHVVSGFPWQFVGYWTVVDDGIYYLVRETLPDRTLIHQLKFYDFARRHATNLGVLPGNFDDWIGGLTISKGRRTVLYSQRTYESSEIVLVDHFR